MQAIIEKLTEIIEDPIDGPYDGEDFWIEADGIIYVSENNIGVASKIIRKVNSSQQFSEKLVRLGKSGDAISIGFDNLADDSPVLTQMIGIDKSICADVRMDNARKFYVYLDGRRLIKAFSKLSQVKQYITRLDKQSKITEKDMSSDDIEDDFEELTI